MPLPIVQRTNEVPPTDKKRFRIFISYSHLDSKDAERFIKFFISQLVATPQLGINKEHVFYDRSQLKAGDYWDESIQQALDDSDYFVFLVSINSISSEYCLARELKTAATRGRPITPIVLSPCPWKGQPLPGDFKNRTLGALLALPKDNLSLRPISEWPENDRADAWNRVVNDLTASMLRDQARPAPSNIMVDSINWAQPRLGIAPLLPYLCNQIDIVNRFSKGIRTWGNEAAESKTLIVLCRGLHDDNVSRFSSLLRCKYLKDWLTKCNEQLLEPRPFVWPIGSARSLNIKESEIDMMSSLSESLTGNSFQLESKSLLGQWLAGLHGVLPIVTTLPKESKRNIATGLQVLLNLLEQCPAEASLGRLVIFILIENDALIGERDLSKSLRLTGYQRTHIVDLMPLQEINEDDIRNWYRAHIETIYSIDEEQLMKKIFLNELENRLRMGRFDIRVRPILGL